ncbi:MAG: hypothetical protein RR533_08430 [Carnobacterium sp.]
MSKRLKTIGKQLTQGMKKLRRKRSYTYYSALGFFFLLYLLIFISGFSSSQRYQYVEVKTGEEMPLGQGTLQVVKREYNPEEKVIRIDYWLSTESSKMDLTKNQDRSTAIEKKDIQNQIEIKTIRVDSNYYVTYVTGLEEGFETVKQTLVPSYIQTLKNAQDEFLQVEMPIYTKETTATLNTTLLVETDPQKLTSSSIQFQIGLVEKQIKELEDMIHVNDETIKAIEKSIVESKEGLKYLISEDVSNAEAAIRNKELEIVTYERENSESEKQIELHKKRIDRLNER